MFMILFLLKIIKILVTNYKYFGLSIAFLIILFLLILFLLKLIKIYLEIINILIVNFY